jgi:AcrR family transcriptional regulator
MDDADETGLPASIAAAWGLGMRPRKGPKRELSLPQIVEAGVRVARADGLAAVSMARVAAELGASTMALYRYVTAKDELLTLMVDAAYGPPTRLSEPHEGWRSGLERWAATERALLWRDPWVLAVPVRGMPTTPNIVGWLEECLRCQRDMPLSAHEKLSVTLLLTSFVRSEVGLSMQVHAAFRAAGVSSDEAMAAFGRQYARLLDPARFPELSAVVAAGAFDEPDDPDGEFTFGMARILDGVEALVRRRLGEGALPAATLHCLPGDASQRRGTDRP